MDEAGPFSPKVSATLARLHAEARGDVWRFLPLLPRMLLTLLPGKSLMKVVSPSDLGHAFMGVSREEGTLLYAVARSIKAQRIVEFGSSFGIGTLYLAAAARDNGGELITTEIISAKCRATEANLEEAGLLDSAKILEGDALETLKGVEAPIDMVFLDGWKDLYVAVLELLKPKLLPGAVLIADNVNMSDAKPYTDLVRAKGSGFVSVRLNKKTEYSCFVG